MHKDNDINKKIHSIKSENEELKRSLSRITIEKQIAEQERDKLFHELDEVRKSKTYKIARGITYLPRKIRSIRYTHQKAENEHTVYTYMISVVVAVYNTSGFLREMLDSVLAQKQDILATYLRTNENSVYKKNVYENIYELILIDDGSDDGSDVLCDEYAKKYPWIKVLHKEHGGVSSARNAGIAIAQGKYITFPDSDDKLSDTVMEDCFRFFEDHENEISLVTYPLRFFDAQSGDHWTAYRFKDGSRILDMMEEWDKPQYFTAASLFKTNALKDHIIYDTSLINGEDIKFVHEVIFHDTARIGLVSTCTYWYRRRSTGEQSAIQLSKTTEQYYIPYITDLMEWLFEEAKNVYGSIPQYIQYAVMGQLQWRLRSDGDGQIAKSIIGEEGFREYRDRIKKLIRQIDIDVLMAQKQLYREHHFYLGRIKTGDQPQRIRDGENISYYFDDRFCADVASCYLKLEFMSIDHGILHLEGSSANLEPDCKNWIMIGDSKISVEKYEKRDISEKILGEIALYVETFKVEIPLDMADMEDLYFGSTVDGTDIIKTRVILGKFMPITKAYSKSYYSEEHWTVRLDENKLSIWNMASLMQTPDFEHEFETQLLQDSNEEDIITEAITIRKQAINRRAWNKNSRQIWLISDRYRNADDNGEALFEFLAKKDNLPVDIYFVIAEDSDDYERLSQIGKVVIQDSPEYMLLYLTADCIISSQADEYIIDPVWRNGTLKNVYKDLYCRRKYVFLQHGVIKDDLSSWLNRYNKNIDGFICSAFKEAQSIHDCNYYYDEQIWLTGLPRYDRLYHNEKKYILIMPTWRKWLMQDYDAADSDGDAIHVKDNLKESDFFKFYNALLNNEDLLEECEKYGYTLCFMPHTSLRESLKYFDHDDRVIFFDFDKKYRDAFSESDLLITDYSSTAMDFAYLEKPVLYAQFDKERFFSGEHTYRQGYFEYEQDGFGEVVYDIDSLTELIIGYMQDGCKLKRIYQERIKEFFAYHDQNNCQRVYEKIADLMGLSL